MELRPYQKEAKTAVLSQWEQGNSKTLLVLPTGCGKTIVFAKIAEDRVRNGERVLILAHRGELLEQAADKILNACGLGCAVEKAEESCIGSWYRITVGSVQSLMREKRLAQFSKDYFNTIIIDEAHHSISDSYQKILQPFRMKPLCGFEEVKMVFSIDKWMDQYINVMQNEFHDRIWFLGLQGSYGRGEAGDQSDIDVVIILDTVSASDLETYAMLLDHLPEREKICGFISGKQEILAWEPSDLFQFCYDTTPILGTLQDLINNIHKEDVQRAIRIGACNVYHMCVHNLVHERSADILKGLYKSAVFTLQAIAFLQTGSYKKKKTDLLPLLQEKDQNILRTSIELKEKNSLSFEEILQFSDLLLNWSSKWIREVR